MALNEKGLRESLGSLNNTLKYLGNMKMRAQSKQSEAEIELLAIANVIGFVESYREVLNAQLEQLAQDATK